MKNNNVREADMWCIRRKGTQPMSKTGYCGIDKIVMDFMETSSPNEEKELFGGDMFFILDWKKELPLYLDEEGYFDQTTTVTRMGYALVKKIVNLGDHRFKICAEDEEFKPIEFVIRHKAILEFW